MGTSHLWLRTIFDILNYNMTTKKNDLFKIASYMPFSTIKIVLRQLPSVARPK